MYKSVWGEFIIKTSLSITLLKHKMHLAIGSNTLYLLTIPIILPQDFDFL